MNESNMGNKNHENQQLTSNLNEIKKTLKIEDSNIHPVALRILNRSIEKFLQGEYEGAKKILEDGLRVKRKDLTDENEKEYYGESIKEILSAGELHKEGFDEDLKILNQYVFD